MVKVQSININNTKEVHLIEVKYMSELKTALVMRATRDIKKSWKQAALFVASPTGFYFDDISTIIQSKGDIKSFEHKNIQTAT